MAMGVKAFKFYETENMLDLCISAEFTHICGFTDRFNIGFRYKFDKGKATLAQLVVPTKPVYEQSQDTEKEYNIKSSTPPLQYKLQIKKDETNNKCFYSFSDAILKVKHVYTELFYFLIVVVIN
jgi:hypothetical protein